MVQPPIVTDRAIRVCDSGRCYPYDSRRRHEGRHPAARGGLTTRTPTIDCRPLAPLAPVRITRSVAIRFVGPTFRQE